MIERVEGGSGAVIATMAAAPEVGGAPGAGADAEQQQQQQQPAMHMDVDQQQPAEHGDDDAVPARVHIKFDAFSSKFNECAFVPLGGGCRSWQRCPVPSRRPVVSYLHLLPPPPPPPPHPHTHTHTTASHAHHKGIPVGSPRLMPHRTHTSLGLHRL